ncbi:tail fiber assembly protein [Xenorhabdus sp. SGI240]|uniref:tail fiber assembly protein n=1 Tax=Xenorhabdus sp. SGI240 TaxID=3158262 RepID=UPI0032B87C2D
MAKYTTNIPMAEFDENGLAIVEGWAEVYLCHAQTHEFLGKSYDRVPRGFSVVADAYLDAPELPKSDDIAICRTPDGKSWMHIPDYRGKSVYHTKTREKIAVDYIGELKPEHTLLAPQTPFDNWNETLWVTDNAALKSHHIQQAEQQKLSLQQQADIVIKPLQDAVDLDMATAAEKSSLTTWRKYRVLLNRVDCATAPDIQWPEQPE